MNHLLRLGIVASVVLLGGCSLLLSELATDFSLAVETEQVTVAQGASGQVALRIDQTIPVDVVPANITVTLHQPPDGVTADDLVIPNGISEDNLIVHVAATATVGVYDVTIRATNGLKTREGTFELTIVAP